MTGFLWLIFGFVFGFSCLFVLFCKKPLILVLCILEACGLKLLLKL